MENKSNPKEYTYTQFGKPDIILVEKEAVNNLLKSYDERFNFIASCIVSIYKDIEVSNRNFILINKSLEKK